jgi:hypothetical protein
VKVEVWQPRLCPRNSKIERSVLNQIWIDFASNSNCGPDHIYVSSLNAWLDYLCTSFKMLHAIYRGILLDSKQECCLPQTVNRTYKMKISSEKMVISKRIERIHPTKQCRLLLFPTRHLQTKTQSIAVQRHELPKEPYQIQKSPKRRLQEGTYRHFGFQEKALFWPKVQ